MLPGGEQAVGTADLVGFEPLCLIAADDPGLYRGLFDQLDIIAALTAGKYLLGPYAALAGGGTRGDGQTSLVYDVRTGELVAVIGPNGAGKTSLLNCITGFYKATSGDMIFNGGGIVSMHTVQNLEITAVRGTEGIREAEVDLDGLKVRAAVHEERAASVERARRHGLHVLDGDGAVGQRRGRLDAFVPRQQALFVDQAAILDDIIVVIR